MYVGLKIGNLFESNLIQDIFSFLRNIHVCIHWYVFAIIF